MLSLPLPRPRSVTMIAPVRFINWKRSIFLCRCLTQSKQNSVRTPSENVNRLDKSKYMEKRCLLKTFPHEFIHSRAFSTQVHSKYYQDLLENVHYTQVVTKTENLKKDLEIVPPKDEGVKIEKLFAYGVLRNTPEYNEKVLQKIRKCILYDNVRWQADCLFKNDCSSEQIDTLKKQIQTMNLHDVIRFQKYLLSILPVPQYGDEWDIIHENFNNFATIWKELDSISSSLLKNSSLSQSLHEMLAISSLWFELGLECHVEFNDILVHKLLTYTQDLDRASFLHLMFSLQAKHYVHRDSILGTVASYLNSNEDVPLYELSLIAMGMFKTYTQMSSSINEELVHFCIKELSKNTTTPIDHFAITLILKSLRYSIDRFGGSRTFRQFSIIPLVNAICDKKAYLLDSNVVFTHLANFLNTTNLFNFRQLHKIVFEKMLSNPSDFRVKDIERILTFVSNRTYTCPAYKLKYLEDYVLKLSDSQIEPNVLYAITYYLLVLGFHPHNLINKCCDERFLSRLINYIQLKDSAEVNLRPISNHVFHFCLVIDTKLRLDEKKVKFLTRQQSEQFHSSLSAKYPDAAFTRRGRFTHTLGDILCDHFPNNFRFMQVLPFSAYAFPVILRDELTATIPPTCNSQEQFYPFTYDHIKPNYFRGSIAILALFSTKDKHKERLRGFSQISKRLLERLGFHVIEVETRQYIDFVLPFYHEHFNMERYRGSVSLLLDKCKLHF